MLARIKKDDLVTVVSGKDKGKQGRIIEIDTKNEKVLVKGLGIVTRHVKAKRQGEKSRIAKEESYINVEYTCKCWMGRKKRAHATDVKKLFKGKEWMLD
jgi:large subunit ribosomal protein L24